MTILLSALSRYHVFDLALQLQRHGELGGLVTAYPKFKLGRYAALEPALIPRVSFALARKAALALDGLIGPARCAPLHELVYSRFAAAVGAAARRHSAAVVYGLSGYMKEALERHLGPGRITVVDHGSLHIGTERAVLREECARFGFSEFGNWQYDWLVRRMEQEFSLADQVVCCSALARESMIQNGVPAHKLVVHRLGVNPAEFAPPARQRERKQGLRLLFVGAMTPLKGLHHLLSAFRQLGGDTELWLVGVLPTDPVLKAMVAECSAATGRVKVIGPVAQAQLNLIYQQCDLFVLPSLSDGWAMVVGQALACALPVVVSDMTGAKELVSPGRNGFIVKSGDPADLAEKLEWALEKCRAGLWERDPCADEHTWDDYGNGWVQWLRQLAA